MLRTLSLVLSLALLPHSSSEQVVVGVAGIGIRLACPGWAGGTSCSWNVSTSSSRVATDLSSCQLKLNPLLPEDAGVHKCSTGQVQLQVKVEPGPPVILEAKEGGRLEVKEGEEVRLECQSQGGMPPAELVWRQKGEVEVGGLRGSKQHVEKREDDRTFKTTSQINFLPANDVTIECWAESEEVGVKRSASVKVELVSPPKIKLRSAGKREGEVWVEEGEKVEIGCEVEARPMNVNFTWILGGREMKGEKGKTLLVEGREDLEGSEAVCLAENKAGSAEEKILIRISKPPIITLHPGLAFANEGEEGRLKCLASGRPEPALAWLREGTGEVVGLGPELIIGQVTRETEGSFLCQAGLRPATFSKPGMLVVRNPPKIISLQEGRLGARTVLECKANSPAEETSFEWIRGGERRSLKQEGSNVEESLIHTSFLVLEEGERAAEYSCRVTNSAGNDQRRVKSEEANFNLMLILGITLPNLLLLFLIVIFICVIGKQKSQESLERMERGKIERKRCLSHRNISFIDDAGANPPGLTN